MNQQDQPQPDLSRLITHLSDGSNERALDLESLFAVTQAYPQGSAALPHLDLLGAAFKAAATAQTQSACTEWAALIDECQVSAHPLPPGMGHVNSLLAAPANWVAWNQLSRLAELRAAETLVPRALEILGLLAIPAIRPMDGSAARPVDLNSLRRLVSFAKACASKRGGDAAAQWRQLGALEPLTADGLRELARETTLGELQRLVKAAADALENPTSGLPPRCSFVGPRPGPKPAASLPQSKPPAAPKKPKANPPKPVRPPSALGLISMAHHARAALAVGVAEHWSYLPIDQLKPCTAGLMQALGKEDVDKSDWAVALLMSLFINHDLAPTLKLSLRQNDDYYYCPTSGCIWLSRKALLERADATEPHGWYYFLIPQALADAVADRLARHPDATELDQLMAHRPDALWVHDAQVFLMTFGDAAHPAYSARWSKSLGYAFAETGAGDALSAHLSGQLPLSADSGSHYYTVAQDPVRAQVRRTFAALDLGDPVQSPNHRPFGSPDAWSDEDVRTQYSRSSGQAAAALTKLRVASTHQESALHFGDGMAACWDGYVTVTGSRPQLPGRLRIDSVLAHRTWHYRWDKDSDPRSDRLLPMTDELASIVLTAMAFREALVERFLALGMAEADVPRLLADPPGNSPLLLQAVPHPRRPASWSVAALGSAEHGGPPKSFSMGTRAARSYWLSEAMASIAHWAERTLGGHGRMTARVGTAALSTPVMTLLKEAQGVVFATMARLKLPVFAGRSASSFQTLPAMLDLRHFDRRDPVASRPADLPSHHCDGYTTPALQSVEICQAELGQGPGMNASARLLMALIVAQGLVFSDDVVLVWSALKSGTSAHGTIELKWVRASGQPISMPLLGPPAIALGLCDALPNIEAAEIELRLWLEKHLSSVQWPKKSGSVIAALCFLAARAVRLLVPPFAVEGSRPELMAATFDDISNTRLFSGAAFVVPGTLVAPTPRRSRPQPHDGYLAQLRLKLGQFSTPKLPLGGLERRARRIGKLIKLLYGPNCFSPCEWLAWRWLVLESEHWMPPRAGRDKPRTWYQYLCHLARRLQKAPREWDPTAFGIAQWREFGAFMLDVSDYTNAKRGENAKRWRLKALTRFLLVLSEDPEYPLAIHALEDQSVLAPDVAYRPSAASTMVLPADVQFCVDQVGEAFASRPIGRLKRTLLLQVSLDLCARDGEACAIKPKDFSADRSWAAVRNGPFAHLKNPQSQRFNSLQTVTQATATELLARLKRAPIKQRFVFAQEGNVVQLHFAERLQDEMWPLLASSTGNPRVRWYSLRGAGLMQRLAPRWEQPVIAWLRGPLLAKHARELMRLLEGRGPGHFTWAIGRTGHASDPVPIDTYLPFGPLVHAAAMCVHMQTIPLSAELAHAIADRTAEGLRKWNWGCRHTYHMPTDEWAWGMVPRYPDWTMKSERPSGAKFRPKKAQSAPQAAAPLRRLTALRYVMLTLLGQDPELEHVYVQQQHRALCDSLVAGVRSFEEVHTSRERKHGIAVPRASAACILRTDLGTKLMRWFSQAELVELKSLDRALKVHMERTPRQAASALDAGRLDLAVQALPTGLGLEIALAAGDLSDVQLARLKDIARIAVRKELKRARDPTSVRVVVWPRRNQNNHHEPAMWSAISRLAVEILLLLPPEPKAEKETLK